MIPEQYQVEVWLGWTDVRFPLSPQLMWHSSGWGNKTLAGTVIDQLVIKAREGLHFPLETQNKNWVLVVGPGLKSVIGWGYRGFDETDFKLPKAGSPAKACRGFLLPEDALPKPCDKPECDSWATSHFKVRPGPYLGHDIWRKVRYAGDQIHSCGKHAREIYQVDALYISDFS